MVLSDRAKAWIAGVLAVVALLGVGFGTVIFGDVFDDAERPGQRETTPTIDVVAQPEASFEPTEVLRLRWGKGPRDVWVQPENVGSTFESFSIDEAGRILIADHPKWHVGARVRRFAPDGKLERTWLTPSGSVFFEPLGDGVMYVLSRGAGPSEQIVVWGEEGSVLATFALAPEMNSTGLLRTGDVIGVNASVPELTQSTVHYRETFTPVLQLGMTEATLLQQVAVPGYGVDTSGSLYVRDRLSQGLGEGAPTGQTVALSDGRALRIPDDATPIGVDGDTVWLVMPPYEGPDDRVERAGWPLGAGLYVEVLAGRVDGTAVGRVLVPWSPQLAFARRRFFLSEGGLWQVVADTEGLSVRRYSEVGR